jgi:hypothetical protein
MLNKWLSEILVGEVNVTPAAGSEEVIWVAAVYLGGCFMAYEMETPPSSLPLCPPFQYPPFKIQHNKDPLLLHDLSLLSF